MRSTSTGPQSGIEGISCRDCILGSGDSQYRSCHGAPSSESMPMIVGRYGYCSLGIQRGTGKRFADLLSENEVGKANESNES